MENKLTVFNIEVIPIYTTNTGEKVVIGRELYERLKISEQYADWMPRMIAYGFTAGLDYSEFWENGSVQIFENAHFKSPQQAAALGYQKNHILKLDMAKHIATIQRTPEGFAIRQKLIELDTNISNLSPELRLLINLELKQKQQDKALAETNRRLDHIGDVIALDTRSWREDARRLIVGIAQKLGGNEYIRDVQAEIYRLLDQRASANIERRLINMRQRMADEGVCKSKRDKLNRADAIAEDNKLIEIYVAIVKEMAVKNGVSFQTELEDVKC